MAMVVLVNGVPQDGRLELKINDVGNYYIVSAVMRPLEPVKQEPEQTQKS